MKCEGKEFFSNTFSTRIMNLSFDDIMLILILSTIIIVVVLFSLFSFIIRGWKKKKNIIWGNRMKKGECYCFEIKKGRFILFLYILLVSMLSAFSFTIPLFFSMRSKSFDFSYWLYPPVIGISLLNVFFGLLALNHLLSELVVTNKAFYVRRARNLWKRSRFLLVDISNIKLTTVPKNPDYFLMIKLKTNSTIRFGAVSDFACKSKIEKLLEHS